MNEQGRNEGRDGRYRRRYGTEAERSSASHGTYGQRWRGGERFSGEKIGTDELREGREARAHREPREYRESWETGSKNRAEQPAEALRSSLRAIDHRSYPAYKSLAGSYRFPGYRLSIDHVQGDPFASPSHLTLFVPAASAGFAPALFETPERRIALEDLLLRQFGRVAARFNHEAKGSGKSGLLSVTACGQEMLERTDCQVTAEGVFLRLHAGFPAYGRTIAAGELEKILFEFLPSCVKSALMASSYSPQTLLERAELADDQAAVRAALARGGLVAFVADGAVLPRESGVSDRPMADSVPFASPETLRVTLELPHRGTVSGMGIRRGITLIAGGGYHGKSTLLKALEAGVYNHVAGDGREFVITDAAAVKLRAEDGRFVRDTDISLFINDLPNHKDTRHFSTEDASGSTSQAAGIVEAVASGCSALLIDEDTSAANFMVRDALMQAVISRDQEPITPFIDRARALYSELGVSTVLVAGSSGAFFGIADTVIQMDNYRPLDITKRVREVLLRFSPALQTGSAESSDLSSGQATAAGYSLPPFHKPDTERLYPCGSVRLLEAKIKTFDLRAFSIDRNEVDLQALEQLTDSGQTAALAYLLRTMAGGKEQRKSLAALVRDTEAQMEAEGFAQVLRRARGTAYVPAGFTRPRQQELYACAVRYRRGL